MRHFAASGLTALALVLLVQTAAVAQVAEVTPLSFDFGDMKQQETRTTKVTVTNKGAALLRIEGVDADCGCTVPTLAKNSLAPGESTDITIEFSSKKFNGKVYKGVHIHTNDPTNGTIDVMITATVHTPLIVEPSGQRLGFPKVMAGETATIRATLTATGDEPLEVTVDKTRKGLFEVRAINNLEGNPSQAAVEVTLPAGAEPGNLRDHLRINTNIPDYPTVDFEVQARIFQELGANPSRLTYRFKKDFTNSIRVASTVSGLDFKVTGVESDLPELKLDVVETIPSQEFRVTVKGQPIGKDDPRAVDSNGRMSGVIRIHTDLASTPVLEIPVTYMVRM